MRLSFLPLLQYVDNSTFNPGSGGNTFADDEIAGVRFPRIKLIHGVDGTNDGDIANTNPFPVIEKKILDATHHWSNYFSIALENSEVVKASAGILRSITVYTAKTSAQWIHVFNSTTIPADTTAPIIPLYLPIGPINITWDFGEDGLYLSTGISICNSTTSTAKTIGAADCWFLVRFK